MGILSLFHLINEIDFSEKKGFLEKCVYIFIIFCYLTQSLHTGKYLVADDIIQSLKIGPLRQKSKIGS